MNIRIPDDVLWSEVGDEVVLLNLASGNYFGLDGVAARIWSLIVAQTSTDEILSTIGREYEVDLDRARHDIDALIKDLTEEGLITLDSSR
jgi:Coenzyme PQQ synthesis protein D (PqqD)